MMDINNFKLEVEKTYNKRNEINGAIYSINNINICRVRKYSEMFCSIKNGSPSNIRDVSKIAKETKWDFNNIEILTGFKVPRGRNIGYFQDYYPDTTWGNVGTILSAKEIKDRIIGFINSNKQEIIPKTSPQEKTIKIIEALNSMLSLNEAHGHDMGEKLRFPENFKIFNVNSNAPITGKMSECYNNSLLYSRKTGLPLCIGAVVQKQGLIDAIGWINKGEINKVNHWLFIYPHAWNLNENGEIFDVTIEWDLDEAFYLGIEVDKNNFKDFMVLWKYVLNVLSIDKSSDRQK